MREYAFCFILLLTLCSVSPFKVYFPGDSNYHAVEDDDHSLAREVTMLCTGTCMDRKWLDVTFCESWCQVPMNAAAVVASSIDIGDLQPAGPSGRHRKSTQAHSKLEDDNEDPNKHTWNRSDVNKESPIKEMAAKRQVDPLLSCIEARCAGVGRGNYGDCIFSKCLAGWKRKRDGHQGSQASLQDRPEGLRHPETQEQVMWTSFLGKNQVKRSWNDVMQTCIEYKCSNTAPGTFDYNVCIQRACSRHMFGKR